MSKHTPGPWEYSADFSDYDSDHTDFSLYAGDMEIIGGCGCCGSPTISSEADARLIAAAPDLLDACKSALIAMKNNDWNEHDSVFIGLRNAIAKAEGAQP